MTPISNTKWTSHNPKANQKRTQRREGAKNSQSKAFLCGSFAALRLCVKVFAFCNDCVIEKLVTLDFQPANKEQARKPALQRLCDRVIFF